MQTSKWIALALAAAFSFPPAAGRAEEAAPVSMAGGPGEIVRSYYPTGELMSEKAVWQDKLDGVSVDYYKSGQPMYEWRYIKGKLHGRSRAFSMEGKPTHEWKYKDGVLNGKTVEYHRNGETKAVLYYKDGKKVGWKIYDENGKKIDSKKPGDDAEE